MLLGTLKALIYVRFSAICGHLPCNMWTLTLQDFFNMWTLTLQVLTKNIVHKTAFTLQRFVCLELIY